MRRSMTACRPYCSAIASSSAESGGLKASGVDGRLAMTAGGSLPIAATRESYEARSASSDDSVPTYEEVVEAMDAELDARPRPPLAPGGGAEAADPLLAAALMPLSLPLPMPPPAPPALKPERAVALWLLPALAAPLPAPIALARARRLSLEATGAEPASACDCNCDAAELPPAALTPPLPARARTGAAAAGTPDALAVREAPGPRADDDPPGPEEAAALAPVAGTVEPPLRLPVAESSPAMGDVW